MQQREILLGITGGVAAYKSAWLASRLVQQGAGVTVVLTAAARKFVTPELFAALSGRKVYTDLFDSDFPLGAHIQLARQHHLVCVAPATAAFMARLAHGLADDLLTALLLAFDGPVVLAPAMNDQMWQHPATQRNVEQLRRDGYHLLGPESGWLSCRQQGVGRMVEPDRILQYLEQLCRRSS